MRLIIVDHELGLSAPTPVISRPPRALPRSHHSVQVCDCTGVDEASGPILRYTLGNDG